MTFKFAPKGTILAAAALLLSACVEEREACPAPDEAQAYTLSIQIAASSLATRVSNAPDDPGLEAEWLINIGDQDYCVYLLDESGRVKQRFEPTSITIGYENEASDNLVYKLKGDLLPEAVTDRMQVMVLANWGSFDGTEKYRTNTLIGSSLTDLYRDNSNYNFTYTPGGAGDISWTPSVTTAGTNGTGIPMFGLSEVFNVTKTWNNTDNKYHVDVPEQINMLRALAKVEIDISTAVELAEADGHKISLESCTLTRYNTTGRFIPNGITNPGWSTNTQQVTAPSMPAGSAWSSNELKLVSLSESGNTLTAYIPEIDLRGLSGDARPRLEVVLKIDEDLHDPYPIELANYDADGKATTGYDALLRNHLYQFNIVEVEVGVSTDLHLHIETKAWDLADDELTYDDLKFAFVKNAAFQWDRTPDDKYEGQYEHDRSEPDPENPMEQGDGKRTLIANRQKGPVGTFTLDSPERGSWTLALYADDQALNDTFRIELWDDSLNGGDGGWNNRPDEDPDTVTRPVDGKEVRFRIVATGDVKGSDPYKARLVMTVKTFDDRIMEVNMPWFDKNQDAATDTAKVWDSTDMPQPRVGDDDYYGDYYIITQLSTGMSDL